ncbi:MAG: CRISPR-associated endoribonuclease Cas6 [bacterium]
MRFKLTLKTYGKENILPINYQYEVASWIYKVLDQGDSEFARWLHKNGYQSGKQYFKFFTFSHLNIPGKIRKVEGDRIYLKPGEVYLTISFLPEKASESFIIGLFKNTSATFSDGKSWANFQVSQVEKLPAPQFRETMKFTTVSPLVISQPEEKNGKLNHKYLSPEDEGFEKLFRQNLVRKFNAREGAATMETGTDFNFRLLSKPRKKGITIKSNTKHPIKVIGYLFDFELTAPKTLTETGYYGGFGDMNSQGFGCGEVGD